MRYGVFLPVGNNGWVLSENSPQYLPTFELNKRVTQAAERHGLSFALAMLKWRGYGGSTGHWDHTAEPITLMSALAACTETIALYASVSPLSIHPGVAAKMAVTVDDVSGGRFGLNVVAGWNRSEYAQLGLWPGEEFYSYRYDMAEEFVDVMQRLWAGERVTHSGRFFTLEDAKLLPTPRHHIDIVSAGASPRGKEFIARYADYHFGAGSTAEEALASTAQLRAMSGGRVIGAFSTCLLIIGDTDAEAQRKVEFYDDGADREAIAFMTGQYSLDTSADGSSAFVRDAHRERVNSLYGGAAVVGSPRTVADRLNAMAAVPGLAGIMLSFDDFDEGLERFGTEVVPLLDHDLGPVDIAAQAVTR